MAKPPIARLGMSVVVLSAAFFGCDRPPSADGLKSWTPIDHHSSDDDKLSTRAQARASASTPADKTAEIAQLVEIAWRQQCAPCHGPEGRGDGQMGPMLRAPDLTLAEWQDKTPDLEIAATIANGKGKMPKFGLPDPVLHALVARIRASRGR